MLVGGYFYTHDSQLLSFDTNDVVLFDIKYFFLVKEAYLFALALWVFYGSISLKSLFLSLSLSPPL